MARIRSIKPEFWSHPVIGKLDDASKCLALALLCLGDDEGYFYADPTLVRNFARPFDDDSSSTRRALDTLSISGWIELAEHPTHGLIGRIINFERHQVIDRKRPSKIKGYFDSTSPRRVLDESSCQEQGTGNREQGVQHQLHPFFAEAPRATAPDPVSPGKQAVDVDVVELREEPKPKAKPKRKRNPKLEIAILNFSEAQQAAWDRVQAAYPAKGWNYSTRSAQPRKTNLALAAERFKTICEEAPIQTADGPLSPDDLANATLAWIAQRQKEAGQGGIPNVPCIENFFSSDAVSKKHWQTALIEFFGISP